MGIKFKKAGKEYLYDLVNLRIEFIHDLHPEYDSETLDMGYELYRKSGFFEPEEKWMVFDVK